MKAKDKLDYICRGCENNFTKHTWEQCPYTINDKGYRCDAFETVKEALDVLDVLKEHKLIKYIIDDEVARAWGLSYEELFLIKCWYLRELDRNLSLDKILRLDPGKLKVATIEDYKKYIKEKNKNESSKK